ncbi:GMC family oxidoreductase N-terminal domain-containing protein [Roseiconus lacunae]|uniref:GMC family oxidoreductase N-terminal domain-containing protein n=1 Tax=Roseiconus lacunae TaxID=2605694 RepID=UPI001E481B90|nr:GMC family oxidoreductase N-terminal domain-containing protein [Roseiconus lacunae]MCD0459338.1 GMC family oxidoreductase N-terminal domain-containing protein [Roseiconus lacunae]
MDHFFPLEELSRISDAAVEVNRRDAHKAALAGGLLPFSIFPDGLFGNGKANCPLQTIREKRFDTLVAILAAQIDALWCGRQGDCARAVACDVLTYASHLPWRMQQGMNVALLWLEYYSVKHTGTKLSNHRPSDVRRVLNQGETRRTSHSPPLICWDDDHLLHMAAAGLAMVGRLVIHSRTPARELIGLGWSEECQDASNLVSIPAPPQADLNERYDVVIIGSGAGGATMAARLTAEGKKVLIVDYGDYVSPDALIQKQRRPDGSVQLSPPRSDEVLYRLYKDAGAQISGGLGKVHSKLELIMPNRRKRIPVRQTINICQAKVFGGGPYVNNAIHLPIKREVYETKWVGRQPVGVDYDSLLAIMNTVNAELGVNTDVTDQQISDRSLRFAEGCRLIGEHPEPLPVSIRKDCSGCGSDNSVDSFGHHVGGVHPYAPDQPNSYLVQAMNNANPVRVSYRTEATNLRVGRNESGSPTVTGIEVVRKDERGACHRATVRANQYVVASGFGPTTKLLAQGLRRSGLRNRQIGKRFSANVGTAVYAMFDKPIWPAGSARPEPGVTQCYIVEGRSIEENGRVVEEPALENWFHFPGTVALALTGWFQHFACAMRKFNHLSMAGIVVPTKVRDCNYIDACGNVHLSLDCDEFDLLLRGMKRIARIYFAAATPDDPVTLYLPTKAMLMRNGCPATIRNLDDLDWAIREIRKRGPAFVNLLTTHGQGGTALGDVVDPESFLVKTDGGDVDNLTVADASLFPAGCEINPQLTLKALAKLSAEKVLDRLGLEPSAVPSPSDYPSNAFGSIKNLHSANRRIARPPGPTTQRGR